MITPPCQDLAWMRCLFVTVPESHQTEDRGVYLTAYTVTKLGWIFREQPKRDYGLDAHVEVVDAGRATGHLIGLLIKSGPSYIKLGSSGDLIFRTDVSHADYWLGHALPVLVVIADVDEEKLYWQRVSPETVVSTGRGRRIDVPHTSLLDADALPTLAALAEGDRRLQRLRQLDVARPGLQLAVDGASLVVEVEEWVNKSSGRGSAMLIAYDENGAEIERKGWDFIAPGWDYQRLIPSLFPWAVVDNAEDDLVDYDEDLARQYRDGIRPYTEDGEIAYWRLSLDPGPIATAYMALERFLDESDDFLY